MHHIQIANIISVSAILLFLLPWCFYVATNRSVFLWLGVVASLADGSTKIWKRVFGISAPFGRPIGACDCDILCTNGNQEGKPGFPSGHMTITSCVVTSFVFLYPSISALVVATFVVILMGWARYIKRCHNMVQIITGTIYGFFVATFFMAFPGSNSSNLFLPLSSSSTT